jgi:predicted metal-dependent hydrolase
MSSTRSAVQTPADLVITPRDRTFGKGAAQARWWYGGDPAATAIYNALSLTFPKGEAFFIDSVRKFRDAATGPLVQQIDDFTRQEAVHSREHMRFNRQVENAGYDVSELQAALAAQLELVKAQPPLVNLAVTLAFEHFTAVLAKVWLADDRYFRGVDPEIVALWRWHAIEEIEHKAVAYDTFLAATKDMPGRKRWMMRSILMLSISRRFLWFRGQDLVRLFRQDRVNTPRTWLKVAGYLLVYPGLLRQVFPLWLSYFRPGFHPWAHDDRDLLKAAEQKLASAPTSALEPQMMMA